MMLESESRYKAVLVGVCGPGQKKSDVEEHLDELALLVDSMSSGGAEGIGAFEVAHREVVRIDAPQSVYLIGSGKAQEIADLALGLDAECIVFDDDLSPAQQRNWERLTDSAVIDRREVILDIFAERARTKPAVTQIELARLEYSLPRLKRAWTHLSRQKGGARGTRGEGETQLEVDRRIALRRISRLKAELRQLETRRETMRKRRDDRSVPVGAIVGYTNAGKSSLLNALTGSDVFVENRLFATLDPTSRSVALPGGETVVLTDTVGFVRKLPHDLVEAFKSTLEEGLHADFLIHVVDAAGPDAVEHIRATETVLADLGALDKPTIRVLNKVDKLKAVATLERTVDGSPGAGADGTPVRSVARAAEGLPAGSRHGDTAPEARDAGADGTAPARVVNPSTVFFGNEWLRVSARTGEGLDRLLEEVGTVIHNASPVYRFCFPHGRSDLAALVHRTGRVLAESYDDDGIHIKAYVHPETERRLAAFCLS